MDIFIVIARQQYTAEDKRMVRSTYFLRKWLSSASANVLSPAGFGPWSKYADGSLPGGSGTSADNRGETTVDRVVSEVERQKKQLEVRCLSRMDRRSL